MDAVTLRFIAATTALRDYRLPRVNVTMQVRCLARTMLFHGRLYTQDEMADRDA